MDIGAHIVISPGEAIDAIKSSVMVIHNSIPLIMGDQNFEMSHSSVVCDHPNNE
jgi:hypothetical protein